jgi:EAL domain-containing protein (putative c-di-GMP-specific phosphodiesterase class I)/DNA-binding response OmpR family regulator
MAMTAVRMPADEAGTEGGRAPASERPLVLVADDDALVRRLVGVALRDAGYDVVEAPDGPAALELAMAHRFAAVLLDNQMPGLSGQEVLTRLRASSETATLPVLLVTAGDTLAERLAGLAAGADDYVTKPFSIEEIVARVRAQLRAHNAWEETLAAHARQRSALARAMAVAGRQPTLEATADVICHALAGQSDVQSAAILRFTADGLVVPIACSGPALWGMALCDPVPAALRRYLLTRSASGPWWERGDSTGSPTPALIASAPAACIPLRDDASVQGLVVLGLSPHATVDPAAALSAGIDFGAVAHGLLRRLLVEHHEAEANRMELQWVLREHAFAAHFQPIVDLADDRVVGVEALTRFADGSSPETRFREAAIIGLGFDLELATLTAAVDSAKAITPSDTWLGLNVSPALVMEDADALRHVLDLTEDRPIVLELSEQEAVSDYEAMRRAVHAVGANIRLSIDDAGSGFASLRHILRLEPAFVKLDRSWVHGVDGDPARQALIAGLRHFADQTGAQLIAEGIERVEERDTLLDLRVDYGQGFLLGRPAAV